MTEAQIIETIQARIQRLGLARGNGIVTGIGDDCAIFSPRGSANDLVFTADMMHQDVHFTAAEDPRDVGHKALTRSLSDCAAMGARPLFCLISLAVPSSETSWVDGFYDGLCELARKRHVIIAGGDLCRTAEISCDVTVCGEVPRGQALLRSKARIGDRIYVSGPLGKAAYALESGTRHLPQARVGLGERLRELGVKCAMDLSDGLSTDLARLCLASGLAAEIARVPIAKGATLAHALHGGEDYQLLFTSQSTITLPTHVHLIGRITKGPAGQVKYQGQPLPPQGWDHFQKP